MKQETTSCYNKDVDVYVHLQFFIHWKLTEVKKSLSCACLNCPPEKLLRPSAAAQHAQCLSLPGQVVKGNRVFVNSGLNSGLSLVVTQTVCLHHRPLRQGRVCFRTCWSRCRPGHPAVMTSGSRCQVDDIIAGVKKEPGTDTPAAPE